MASLLDAVTFLMVERYLWESDAKQMPHMQAGMCLAELVGRAGEFALNFLIGWSLVKFSFCVVGVDRFCHQSMLVNYSHLEDNAAWFTESQDSWNNTGLNTEERAEEDPTSWVDQYEESLLGPVSELD